MNKTIDTEPNEVEELKEEIFKYTIEEFGYGNFESEPNTIYAQENIGAAIEALNELKLTVSRNECKGFDPFNGETHDEFQDHLIEMIQAVRPEWSKPRVKSCYQGFYFSAVDMMFYLVPLISKSQTSEGK